MGVQGLFSFINKNKNLYLHPTKLHDCSVVIDGLNLAYVLHDRCEANCAFGGDYDVYARFVSQFFDTLDECGIHPVVLLDGSCDSQKVDTIINRTANRVNRALNCTPQNQNSSRVFPLLGIEVFISVLREKKVRFEQCEKEADSITAYVAKCLNAPVISTDSDFYVFDVRFIPLHTLAWKPTLNEGVRYLTCQEFDRGRFLKQNCIDLDHLPLFATLVGNDYLSDKVTSAFKGTGVYKFNRGNKFGTIPAVLRWLKQHQKPSRDGTIQQLLNLLQEDERIRIRETLRLGMDAYLKSIFAEDEDLIGEAEIMESLRDKPWEVKTNGGADIPKSFQIAFRKSKLPRFCLDILVQRFAILKLQVECYKSFASFYSARDLLLGMSWILLSDSSEEDEVSLFMRRKGSLAPMKFTLKEISVPSFPQLPQIQELPQEKRKELYLRILKGDVKLVEELPDDLRLFLMSVLYWIRFSKEPVKVAHCLSIALCLIYLYVIEHRKQVLERDPLKLELQSGKFLPCMAEAERSLKFEHIISRVSKEECIAAKSVLNKYVSFDAHAGFQKNNVQIFANLQAIIYVARSLNAIFGDIFVNPSIQYLLNCTFLYNICFELTSLENPKEHVTNMLKRTPNVYALFNVVSSLILTTLNRKRKQDHIREGENVE